MARLPRPGADNGTWGNILNDFLAVEHNADGTLKASGSLAAKADDNAVVHTTGNEQVSGTKTFTASPVIPTPTLGSQATNKSYVDSAVTAGAPDASTTNKGIVQLAGDLAGTAASPTVPGLASKVPTSRQILSGTGLTGGGDLTVDRTLSVSYGTAAGTAAQGNDSRITGAEQTTNKGQANGYAPLDSSSKVPTTNLGGSGANSSTFLRGDQTWAAPPSAPNATSSAPGLVQLTGDLGGTATSPKVLNRARSATIVVAASNSSTNGKNAADYLCTGTNDDVAINNAISALSSSTGGRVVLLEGQYTISNPIVISHSYVTLEGQGPSYNTVIQAAATISQTAMLQVGASSTLNNIRIANLAIKQGDGSNVPITGSGHGILFCATDSIIENVRINFSETDGVHIIPGTSGATQLFDVILNNVYVYAPGQDGFFVGSEVLNSELVLCKVKGGNTQPTPRGRHGFYVQGSDVKLINCHPYYNQQHGLNVDTQNNSYSKSIVIIGGEYENNGRCGISMNAAQSSLISEALFYGNNVANNSYEAVLLAFCGNVTLQGNSFRYPSNAAGHIYISSSTQTIIDGNIILGGDYQVVEMIGTCTNSRVSHNTMTGADTSVGTHTVSVRLNGVTNVDVIGNMVDRSIIEANSADSNRIEDNNLVQLVSPPNGQATITTVGANTQVFNNKNYSSNQLPTLSATGLTGATAASRYAGATASGAPTTGTFATGDFVVDQTGKMWICTAAGSPGTWTSSGGATLGANTFTGNQTAPAFVASGLTGATSASRYVGATASGAPSSGTFAVGDFALDQTGVIWICTAAGTPGTWIVASKNLFTPYTGLDGDLLTSGEETINRKSITGSCSMPSGTLRLAYFTARKSETVNNIQTATSATAAGATPTLCQMGLYSVDGSGNLTLVASCANDTTLFAAASTLYTRTLTSSYSKVKGQRYAFGVLVVTSAATPTVVGNTSSSPGSIFGSSGGPRVSGNVTGQSSIPSSVAAASVSDTANIVYGVVTP